MKKTLTLSRPVSPTQEKPKSTKPPRSEKDIAAYKDLGFVMKKIYERGLRVRWDKPFAKGIYDEIRKVLTYDEISSNRLNEAIKHHVKSPKYLLTLREGAPRFNAFGKKKGEVTAEESKIALSELYDHHGAFMKDRRRRKKQKTVVNNVQNKHRQNLRR